MMPSLTVIVLLEIGVPSSLFPPPDEHAEVRTADEINIISNLLFIIYVLFIKISFKA
jgi:hypothetical protein